ncbi:nucleoside monophosphate kinase [Anabaena cylindrica FACHB-243]|uniref:adenylate kinase family protein n=1 Tax=Anabaena TaxID=1163 RepID=UPI0005A864E9|nr:MULTISPECIES: nucleoside monophosphate kinase [Anabaena]MBD2419335.1 nucleoside monophosphate kinase [Anabaena cylindrica FACHB-243]MBY5282159.1 nucleoside monophosphate kinase [Anabaena sp. CCAP 1446/1C]MBY5307674.1 nucleoside monophosphate kinase [Anabaena sp. CCAP 1446/1C]MCM2409151.1 nucleoside monophosphate kinase [Anabaena sp. CCAP 1446/1C]
MRLVILGGSGSGKSTQAQRLCKYFGVPLISTGEILRDAISGDTTGNGYGELNDLGRNAQPYVIRGELVPDEMMIEFIKVRLSQQDANCGWVLEGYPRTAFQAEELDFLLDNLGEKLNWAIYLQVPQVVMVSRSLGRSLPDDQPEIVQRRVELFYDRTIPILEYYDRRRRLLTINGDDSPEQVQHNILTLLG